MHALRLAYFLRQLVRQADVDRTKVINICRTLQSKGGRSWSSVITDLKDVVPVDTIRNVFEQVVEKFGAVQPPPPQSTIVIAPTQPARPKKRRRNLGDAFREGKAAGLLEGEKRAKSAYLEHLHKSEKARHIGITSLTSMRKEVIRAIGEVHPDKSKKIVDRHLITTKMTDLLLSIDNCLAAMQEKPE